MGLTINQLVAMPHLQTTWRAGREGGDRLVMWAHSCELSEPWEWLGSGDLLMTNGLALPPAPDEQARFIARLDAAGLSGVAIGQGLHAPPLQPELLGAAEELAFPVLETAYEVPFVAVARAVTLANQSLEHSRLITAIRVYDTMRAATIAGKPAAQLVTALGVELGCRLHVLDERGRPMFADAFPAPASLTARVVDLANERGSSLPSVVRLGEDDAGADALVVPIPCARLAVLLVLAASGRSPDLAALQHAATVIAVEVERLSAYREEQRRGGSELFAHLVDHRIDVAIAEAELRARGLEHERPLVVACCPTDASSHVDLHQHLAGRDVPHLLLRRDDLLLVLLSADPTHIGRLQDVLGNGHLVGLSDGFVGARGVPDAAREARWALAAARSGAEPVVRYGDSGPLFLPRTLSEAHVVVERVLGPVIAYDAQHGTELIASLRVLLQCNRSWQRACSRLHVAKQTLVYRMQRVEQLTGRHLRETDDVAQLWLALRTLEVVADRGEFAP